jgi:hypothetical protein
MGWRTSLLLRDRAACGLYHMTLARKVTMALFSENESAK